MNDVPLHSGSRWEPPNGTASPVTASPVTSGLQATTALADPAPVTVTSSGPDERDRRRPGPRAALVALLALLVMVLSGAWVAWGDQLRALVQPGSPAAPVADQGGGSQPWAPDEPGDDPAGGGPSSRHHRDRTGPDGDEQRGGPRQLGDDPGNATNDDDPSTQGDA